MRKSYPEEEEAVGGMGKIIFLPACLRQKKCSKRLVHFSVRTRIRARDKDKSGTSQNMNSQISLFFRDCLNSMTASGSVKIISIKDICGMFEMKCQAYGAIIRANKEGNFCLQTI